MRVDEWCRNVMTKLLQIAIKAIVTRKRDKYVSYETDVFRFLQSDKLDNISKASLPVELYKNHAACSVVVVCLDCLIARLMKDALVNSRKVRNPEFFER